jgi:hypothetical protein
MYFLSFSFLEVLTYSFFSFNEVTISFSLSIFKFINTQTIDLQLLSLFLLFCFIFINRKHLFKKVRNFLSLSEEQKQKNEEARIKYFERKYSTYSSNELQNIVDNKKSYAHEAVMAAQRLLETEPT